MLPKYSAVVAIFGRKATASAGAALRCRCAEKRAQRAAQSALPLSRKGQAPGNRKTPPQAGIWLVVGFCFAYSLHPAIGRTGNRHIEQAKPEKMRLWGSEFRLGALVALRKVGDRKSTSMYRLGPLDGREQPSRKIQFGSVPARLKTGCDFRKQQTCRRFPIR